MKYSIDFLLKNFLGFDDWILLEHCQTSDGQIIWIKIGRWHGYELLGFKIEEEFE